MCTSGPDLKRIFARAIEIDSTSARADYVAEACGDDDGLRNEVVSLLLAHDQAGDFLDSSIVVIPDSRDLEAIAEHPGLMIGPYKLRELIGEGGMGTVYSAEQAKPIHRAVALKIIKPGLDSRQVIARFEAERQTLALMDHPNIAKVLDVGATDSGRPYFVMELIEGVSITESCDRAQLNPRERLKLLVTVCHAVQHAHQKGIIHRDLKPSNVLIAHYDGKPVPKVIDFGVAKAIDQRLTERTLFTQHGAILGTFEYMSPEQADPGEQDIDTRSDVYSLGVLLYELMSGTTPLERHRLRKFAHSEILRRIREEEPPKLSARLSQVENAAEIAARRGTEPVGLARLLRRELDWIALKALEKDPNRRYGTANDLARDVQRYLDDEPVEAGPPSTTYQLRKYARKHRVALSTIGTIGMVLIFASAISAWMALRATREAARAVRSEAESKSVVGFFRDKVLAAARPKGQRGGLGPDATLGAAVDAAEKEIAADFASQPGVEAAIRDSLGTSYLYLGRPEAAILQYQQASKLREQVLGPDHPETHASRNNLAVAYQAAGRFAEAVPIHERGLAHSKATLGLNHPDTLKSMNNLAVAYRRAGRTSEALSLFKAVLALRKANLPPDHPDIDTSLNNLAVAYQAAGRFAEALPIHEQELAHCKAALGPNHPDTLKSMNNLAGAYLAAGKLDKARLLFEQTLDARRTTLGADHPDTLTTLNNLAAAQVAAGRADKALDLFEEVYALKKHKLGAAHPDTLTSLSNLANLKLASGKVDAAVPQLESVLALRKSTLGDQHPETLKSMNSLADAYLEQKKWPEAATLLQTCLTLRERRPEADEWRRFSTMSQLGSALTGLREFEKAEPLLLASHAGLLARLSTSSASRKKDLSIAASRIVRFYKEWGKPEKGAEWQERLSQPSASSMPNRVLPPDDRPPGLATP